MSKVKEIDGLRVVNAKKSMRLRRRRPTSSGPSARTRSVA